MAYQLILTSDTLDIGRQKINSFMQSSSGIWSSDTPNFSVVSTQGLTNSNYALSNYSFVVGKDNEVRSTLGAFSVIAGGYNNYCNGPYTTIAGGSTNKQSNSAGRYNVIVGGKNNFINEGNGLGILGPNQYRNYNAVIAGSNNTIKGQRNFIANGNLNSINYGRGNVIFGSGVSIRKNSYVGSNVGPQSNIVIGNTHNIIGAGGFFMNEIRGFNSNIRSNSAGFSSTNTLWGYGHRVDAGQSFNFFVGSNILNRDSSGGYKSFCFMMGQGNPAASPSSSSTVNFHTSTSQYQFVLASNATRRFRFRFDSAPQAYISAGSGAFNVGSADYGEYFEWSDGNQQEENRAGYFVEIESGKVKIAKSNNVIGVVSKTTGFIGDSKQDYWSERYLKDEWGVTLIEKYDKFYVMEDEKRKFLFFDKKGNCYLEIPSNKNPDGIKLNMVKEQCIFDREIEIELENPDYDPTKIYIPRNKRKEWEVIGLLGKLRVRTKEQITGNSVDVDEMTGMAKNGTKYPVLEKNKDFDGNYGIVTIFFK